MMKREGWVGTQRCWFGMEGCEEGTGGRDRGMLVWDGRLGMEKVGLGLEWLGGDTDTSPFLSFAPHSLVIHLVRNLKKRKKGERNE